jgi:hypothetical protein
LEGFQLKDGNLKEMVSVDIRVVIAAFCLLIILQLFPSYFLFGLHSIPYVGGSAYLIWVGFGTALVSGFISKRAGRLAVLECIVATAMYCLAIFLIYGGHRHGYAFRSGLGSGGVIILLVFLLCIFGSI